LKIDKVINRVMLPFRKHFYLSKYPNSSSGTIPWLIGTEIKYGGMVTNLPIMKVSSNDPRTEERLKKGRMMGGDRMLHNFYSKLYSKHLIPIIKRGNPVSLAEFGILKGTGLAIWCDLFPNGRILGFDVDLGHINDNRDYLTNLGAFTKNKPELYEYDQFLDNTAYIESILKGDKIDICIDDGYHSIESIITTMKSVMHHLAEKFVYFIEDNKFVHKEIRSIYPDLSVENKGAFTIVTRVGE